MVLYWLQCIPQYLKWELPFNAIYSFFLTLFLVINSSKVHANSFYEYFVNQQKIKHAAILGSLKLPRTVASAWSMQQLVSRINRSSYRYSTTKASVKAKQSTLAKISIVNAENTAANKRAIKAGIAIGKGINTARELGNLPGNICTPKYLSSEARKLGRQHAAIKTTVLGDRKSVV